VTDGKWVGWIILVESGCGGKVADTSEVDIGLELNVAVVVGEGDSPNWVGSEPVLAVQADRTITTANLPKIIPTFFLSIGLNVTIKAGYDQYSINIQP
jgi:hypothetical protein